MFPLTLNTLSYTIETRTPETLNTQVLDVDELVANVLLTEKLRGAAVLRLL